MLALQKRCFLHAMSQEKGAGIRTLAALRGKAPEKLLAQLTCNEFLQLVEQLKNPPRGAKAAAD